jgi:hypothetical protein
MFFNLITAEFLFAVGMGTAIVAMWPDINWDYSPTAPWAG